MITTGKPSERQLVQAGSRSADQADRRSALLLWTALGGVLALALSLRLYGVNFGLPQLYYWDEPTVVQRAVRFANGDPNPHFFYYPALYMYVLFVVSGALFVFGNLFGLFHGVTDFATRFFVEPTSVYLAARVATALIGTACVYLTYAVGRRFFGRLAGLLGALFLAVSVVHATHSHIAITDVPQSLFIIAAYLPLHGVVERGRWRDYLLCGLLIGLGMATKYLAIFLLPALALAHLLRVDTSGPAGWRSLRWWWGRAIAPRIWAGFAAALAGFFVGSPFNLLDFTTFMRDFQVQSGLSEGDGAGNSLWSLLGEILPGTFGWPLYLLALGGLLGLLISRRRQNLLFLVFPLLYFAFVARYPIGFPRYVVPLEPFLALAAGYALQQARPLFLQRLRQPALATTAQALLLLGLIAAPAVATLRWDIAMAREVDTRSVALQWAEAQLPAGTPIALQRLYGQAVFNAPLLTDAGLDELDQIMPRGGRFDAVREAVFQQLQERPLYREVEMVYDYAALEASGARYVFVSDQNWYGLSFQAELKDAVPTFKADLERKALLVQRFAPEPGSWSEQLLLTPGIYPFVPPVIEVYELR